MLLSLLFFLPLVYFAFNNEMLRLFVPFLQNALKVKSRSALIFIRAGLLVKTLRITKETVRVSGVPRISII